MRDETRDRDEVHYEGLRASRVCLGRVGWFGCSKKGQDVSCQTNGSSDGEEEMFQGCRLGRPSSMFRPVRKPPSWRAVLWTTVSCSTDYFAKWIDWLV